MVRNNNWIKEIINDRNVSLLGFADLSDINIELCNELKYGISIAIALEVFPSITNEPSKDYYNEYNNVSKKLKETSNYIADYISKKGFKAYSLANERQNDEFRTRLPSKTLATRAGLGWIGKSATLVTKQYGNAIRISGVITDMPFETGMPINSSFCGNCDECVKKCPGKAILGNIWNIHVDRDTLLNPYECKKTVINRGKIWNVTEGSCGICLAVCPYTIEYIKRIKNNE